MATNGTNSSAPGSANGSHTPKEIDTEKLSPRMNPRDNNPMSPSSWRGHAPSKKKQRTGSIDLDDYFVGPREMDKHSKWPYFLRMHGSVLPKMILPLGFIGVWATAITLICEKVHDSKSSPTTVQVNPG